MCEGVCTVCMCEGVRVCVFVDITVRIVCTGYLTLI